MYTTDVFMPELVTIYPEGAERWAELYRVVLATERGVVVEGCAAALAGPLPVAGTRLVVEAPHSGALLRMSALVRDVRVREVVRMALAQASPIKRIQRRRSARLHVPVLAYVIPLDEVEQGSHQVMAEDVSAGGLRLVLPCELETGSKVLVSLSLGPRSQILDFPVTVLHSRRRHRTGDFDTKLRFDLLTPGEEKRLARFLMDLLRRQVSPPHPLQEDCPRQRIA